MRYFIFIITVTLLFSCTSQQKECILKGEIIDHECDTLLLFKASKFPIYETKIPVINSKYLYAFPFTQSEVYELVNQEDFQKDKMHVDEFFAEGDTIFFKIFQRMESQKNQIVGNDINNSWTEYKEQRRSLFWDRIMIYSDSLRYLSSLNQGYSDEFYSLVEKISNEKDPEELKTLYNERKYLINTGLAYSPQAKYYRDLQDSIFNEMDKWEYEYINDNTSLLTYYLLLRHIQETAKVCCWSEVDIDLIKDAENNLDRLTSAIPNHPYEKTINDVLSGMNVIKEGGRFIDFVSYDFDGNSISVAEQIKNNRLVLLDFWSPWCKSCLQKNKELVPIYNEYQNRGFEIIAVAQAFKDQDLKKIVTDMEHPWKTTFDKDNKEGVWEKYNLNSKGGGTFLVNSSGVIIAVDPKTSDLQGLLAKHLN